MCLQSDETLIKQKRLIKDIEENGLYTQSTSISIESAHVTAEAAESLDNFYTRDNPRIMLRLSFDLLP